MKVHTTFPVVKRVQIVQRMEHILLKSFHYNSPVLVKESKIYPANITCVQLFVTQFLLIYFLGGGGVGLLI